MTQKMKIILIAALLTQVLFFCSCNNANNSQDLSDSIKDSAKMEKSDEYPLTKEDSLKLFSNTLSVSGDIEIPLLLTVDSLKKMNVVTLDSLNIVCQTGAVMNNLKSSRGVLLRDILKKAEIKQSDHKDRNFYFVARATDNYKATFSWGEIFNNPTGDNTYVIFEENNQPISIQGAMVLNCNNDIKTGPRHVYWLKSIEVHRVD